MLIGKIHIGSGLGDQLFSYLATRFIALNNNYDFGFIGKENFKGKDFMDLDWGKEVDLKYRIEFPAGKLEIDEPHKLYIFDKPYYDPLFNFVEDDTVIDGTNAQDERYWDLEQVNRWLKVEPLKTFDDVCIVGFRGGEYATVRELFLTSDYWTEAIGLILSKGIKKFEIHTDDVKLAKDLFCELLSWPDFEVIHDIGVNWRSIRYAKHLIIANSAFFILPSLLNRETQEVIAPKYWAGRNVKEWRRPQNYYKKFTYI